LPKNEKRIERDNRKTKDGDDNLRSESAAYLPSKPNHLYALILFLDTNRRIGDHTSFVGNRSEFDFSSLYWYQSVGKTAKGISARRQRVMDLNEVYTAVLEGKAPEAEAGVKKALEEKNSPEKVLKEALIPAMDEVGRRFEIGEYYVPEMLIAARAMKAGIGILRPLLAETGVEPVGKVLVGTVMGDLHDIGKNLVGLMLEGAGFEVIDMGSDVTPDKFLEAVKQEKPQLIGMSALLTTTMNSAGDVIKALVAAGVRESVKVMVGGAPVTQDFVNQIGADGYAPDAASAARKARELIGAA
jgi:5-methyltetrahydrofolate--homocysteine methyltransferase